MIQWLALLPPLLVAIALICVLGFPYAWGLRARGFAGLIVIVPASFATLAVSAIAAPLLGLSWSLLIPLCVALPLGIVLRITTRHHSQSRLPASRPNALWLPLAAAAFAGGITAYALAKALPGPAAVSQTYDAIFHLNAVQLIIETQNASPLAMDLAAPGNPSFYPTVWHSLVALVAQLTGASVPLATNATLFASVSFVWAVGAVGLGRAVVGPGGNGTLSAGVFAAVFPSLPLSLAGFGVLYPNLLSMSLLPYVLIAIAKLSDTARARRTDVLNATATVLLLIGALGSATLTHPNALHASFLLSIGFVIVWCVTRFKHHHSALSRIIGVSMLAASLAAGVAFWRFGRTSLNDWGGSQGPFGAVIEAFGTAPRLDGHNWVVTCFVLLGLLAVCFRRTLMPYVIALVLVLGFYVLAEGFTPGPIRELFLSPWYSDPWRLAAIVPLALLPFAVLGGKLVLDALRPAAIRFLAFAGASGKALAPTWVTFVAIGGLALAGTSLYGVSRYIEAKYASTEDSAPLLSLDELTLLERLDEHVSPDDMLLVNPWNGGALAYAIAERHVALPHAAGSFPESTWQAYQGITRADPSACAAADTIGARYVLDFGEDYVFKTQEVREELAEISGVTVAPGLTQVDREGDAVLYEITGCNWKEQQ
ncbi:DUF6541 family protein [Leucobacter chinensis]|uniref:DUF6541 family protein n=1 Tax=Leucobacter chinensis TaxID=2851010 RepID=UPI001C22141C|nr:DUF6541 family protein [Leucobacter chinensis]